MVAVTGQYFYGTSDRCFHDVDQSQSQLAKRLPLVSSVVENACSPSLLLSSFVSVFVIICQEYVVKESFFRATYKSVLVVR
jgi:hypothetical protein